MALPSTFDYDHAQELHCAIGYAQATGLRADVKEAHYLTDGLVELAEADALPLSTDEVRELRAIIAAARTDGNTDRFDRALELCSLLVCDLDPSAVG